MRRRAIALVAVGVLQMAGSLSGLRPVAGCGLATGASPAPRVFTSVDGLETFSSRFFAEWTGRDGRVRSVELTPERYAGLAGPYPRRNAYGAALAYGPVLAAREATRAMVEAVGAHAVCGDAPLLAELGIDARERVGTVRVRVVPPPDADPVDFPLVLELPCS